MDGWQALRRKISPPKDEQPVPISIVIPTYNVAHTIRQTLNSLKAQDHPEVEILIVDAGSTDATLDIISRSYDGKVRIYSVAAFHLGDMYNRGVSLATSPYVGFMFPGDTYLHPSTLTMVSSTIKSHG